jgi:hypothetical protein
MIFSGSVHRRPHLEKGEIYLRRKDQALFRLGPALRLHRYFHQPVDTLQRAVPAFEHDVALDRGHCGSP